ncbi:type II toxin-antitoxin system TacA family antitoxin [Sphingobacterium hungaricum]|uniref:DUF1778 domain-containing protein n=1 Tax=Sphingobacterium hungaricum TaxID=2082723 RepID=A0A928YQY9_9SPHI|nr:DUF1778 domain-containing protein [Sphingobacterium hungaricum]MBE8714102.1 DUF1778 domain-containing protein [Sphingobacterium hungaricum]
MGTNSNDRIDVRISKEQKELVKYASSLSGFKNLSEFIVFCINKESKKIIKENNEILKSLEDKKIFVNAILNPAEPNEKLKEAHKKFNDFIDEQNENRSSK